MTMIKQIRVTPSEANELIHDGFILKLISIGLEKDTYAVYVVGR
jgi:hypothetical protein